MSQSNFVTPTLSQTLAQVSTDLAITGGINTAQYNAIVEGVKYALSVVANGLYAKLDTVALQCHPYTATGISLEQFAAVWGVFRLPPTASGGTVPFTGTNGADIPANTLLQSRYGIEYLTGTDTIISGGVANISVVAATSGANTNLAAGEKLTLVSPLSNVNATVTLTAPLTNGTDIESYPALQTRWFDKVRNPPAGGSQSDYVGWALDYPGVTRAWCVPVGMGAGTVLISFMMDNTYVGGIPLAPNVAALYNYLLPFVPADCSQIFVAAPVAAPLNPVIAIKPNTAAVQAAVTANLAALILAEANYENGTGSGEVLITQIENAIDQSFGLVDYVLTTPAANVMPSAGQIVTLGAITFSTLP
jgi:uncharacterized phage protein gp47/JayE